MTHNWWMGTGCKHAHGVWVHATCECREYRGCAGSVRGHVGTYVLNGGRVYQGRAGLRVVLVYVQHCALLHALVAMPGWTTWALWLG